MRRQIPDRGGNAIPGAKVAPANPAQSDANIAWLDYIRAPAKISFMADIENIMLEHLHHIRGAIDGLREDMREVKTRLGHVEEQVGGLYAQYASLSRRIDRLDERLERVERRLELVE